VEDGDARRWSGWWSTLVLLRPCGAGRAWICDDLTSPACAYIRVHRRAGTDRLLSKQELEDWARRMMVRAPRWTNAVILILIRHTDASWFCLLLPAAHCLHRGPGNCPVSVARAQLSVHI